MEERNRSYERLLLDDLADDKRAELEEAALADDEVFERLQMVEDALVDERARGELAAGDEHRFDATLGYSPRLRERLAVARLLAREADRAAVQRSAEPSHGRVLPFLRRFDGRWPAALAAAVVLVVAGLSAYRLLQRGAEPAGGTFALVLRPAALRSSEEPVPPVSAPAGTEHLELYLELADDPGIEAFEAVLLDDGGAEVERVGGLGSSAFGWGDAVVFGLPLEPLLGRSFEVHLVDGETGEEVASYRLRLTRP